MKSLQQVIHAVQYELDCSISELSRKLGKSRNYLFTHMKNRPSEEKEQEIINLLLELVDDENTMLRNVVVEQEETITAYLEKLREVINEKLSVIEEKNNTIPHLHERLINTSRKLNERTESQNATIVELNNTITTKDLFIDGQDEEIEKLNKTLNSYRSLSDIQAQVIEKLKMENKEESELIQIASNQIDRRNETIEVLKDCINRKEETIEELIEGKFTVMDQLKEREKSMEALAQAGHSTGASLRKAETENCILTGALISVGLLLVVGLWVMK